MARKKKKEEINEENVKQEEVKDQDDNLNNLNADLQAKVEILEKEKEEINTQLLRLQADFINYRNRVNKEKENSIAYGMETIVCEILPVIDNFNRALENEENTEGSFYKGIKMIEKQLLDVLEKNSVIEIKALGEEFDPNFHHAVVMEESEDHDSNTVIEILQKGYKLKDKVIRPSMVKVSK